MGPLESRNDFAMVFFRKDFHPRRKLHPQIVNDEMYTLVLCMFVDHNMLDYLLINL